MDKCSICDVEFEEESEGGVIGYLGILPVAFCPTCFSGIMDMAEMLRVIDDEENTENCHHRAKRKRRSSLR